MLNWKLDQGIVLSVYVKKDGEWVFVDYFNEPGPLQSRAAVMEIDLSHLPPGDLEIKLESGFLFWEIDSVGVDYTPNIACTGTVVPLEAGVNQDLENISSLLRLDDSGYYTQTSIGEYAELRFATPPQNENLTRTVFLHSKGYYEMLRQFQGESDLTKLNSFREPLAFPRFGLDLFHQMSR